MNLDAQRPLVRTRLLITDPGQAPTLFQGPFPGLQVTGKADGPAFRLAHDRASDGRLTVNRLEVRGSVVGKGSTAPAVGAARVRSGRFRLDYGRTTVDTTEPYLRPPGRSQFRMENAALELLELDPGAYLHAAAHHLHGTGLTPVVPTPDTAAPVDAMRSATWHRVADLAAAIAFDGDGFKSPLVRAALFDLIISSAIATFPGTVRHGPPVAQGARAAAVRRAISFIEDHLAEPLDVVTIAQAARVPVRTLQSAFRTDMGVGVMTHVRTRRLTGAHRDLLQADLSVHVTVKEIAHRWGFLHVARFAQRYRQAYGENPSETLRR